MSQHAEFADTEYDRHRRMELVCREDWTKPEPQRQEIWPGTGICVIEDDRVPAGEVMAGPPSSLPFRLATHHFFDDQQAPPLPVPRTS